MTTNQQEDFAVRLCELYEQVTQNNNNNNNNNNHQFTLFVNHAFRTMQALTDPLIDAMDDEEDILSYQQSKDRVQSLTESTLAQLQQQQSSSSSSNSHVMLFLTAYVHMSMAQVLNQSTNDDDVIQENLTRVIQEWNQVIESLSKDEKGDNSSAIVLSQFYRAEANRMLVDRGLDVESAGKEAEKDYLAVIEKVPQFSYAYESLNHVYTGMGSGDENKALAILSKGIDFGLLSASNMSPLDKSILYLARGFYYAYEDGDTEQALVDYKNALECDASCANKIPKKLYQQLNP